ncbi:MULTISPECIES: hypothetical protein [Arcobacteraceae]|uniref:hypothetical protein n=1 Tax=Arcobacteraceae TaxID=2808963 RepID=UPI000DE8285E|nr:hypothetical protein [Arcobacter sp. CECT 9188]RBQ27078.1 hypothetical protein CRU88_04905 [Arcobacter sp. CECT 9188]
MIFRLSFLTIFLKLSLFSCADYWDPSSVQHLFLEKKDNIFLQLSEDLKNPGIYNEVIYKYNSENKTKNIKELEKEFQNRYSFEQIEEFLYKRQNLNNLRDKDFLEYIKFAEIQEKCVTYNYYNPKPENCGDLTKIALNNLEKVESSYFKLRYFYLAFRLSHFNKQEPLKIYEKYKYLLDQSDSIVKDWIQGIYSGALIKDGQKIQGVYEFTKLFDVAINKHLSLYNFHHIKTQEEFDELLNLTKNSDEKTKIYALRALDDSSNVIEEMQNIYKIDNNSKWLDFLLYRELLKSQTYFNAIYYEYFQDDKQSEVENIFYKKYIEFLKDIKKEDRYLVDLSLIYFNIYTENFTEAKKIMNSLLDKYPNSHEVQVASYILYLNSLTKIDEKIENEIISKIDMLIDNNHSSNSIYEYTLETLEKRYKKQGLDFDQFLVRNALYSTLDEIDLKTFRTYEEFLDKPQTSKLKQYLQNRFKLQMKNGSSPFDITKLSLLINNLLFQEALDTKLPILDTKIEFNPFNGLIRGNNRSGKKEQLTIKEFLEKIIVIQKELEKNPNSVMDNFLYANALYNLSYFGNSDRITTVYRSSYSIHTPKMQKEKLDLAIKHYNIALNKSKDKEFKAKLTYMISKAYLSIADLSIEKDRWNYYNQSKYNYGTVYEKFLQDNGAKYFDNLKDNFSDTKYYQELISSCGDFRTYINSKK